MKTFLNKVVPLFLLLTAIIFIGSSCGGDPLPQQADSCDHNGWFYQATLTDYEYLIDDTALSVQFFPNASNGPFGNPGFEISGTNAEGHFMLFVTDVITAGGTGVPLTLSDDSVDAEGTITLSCLEAGTSVGDRVRYNIEGPGYQIEICALIDQVL